MTNAKLRLQRYNSVIIAAGSILRQQLGLYEKYYRTTMNEEVVVVLPH
jgi:hypothetical protein